MEKEIEKFDPSISIFPFFVLYMSTVLLFEKRIFSFTTRSIFRIINNSIEESILGRKESRILVDQDRIRTSLLARLLWTVFYVTTRALKHHGRNAILLDPTSYSSVATDAATHVLMNVFLRETEILIPPSPALERNSRRNILFSHCEQSNNVAKDKNHNFLRKKNKKKYIILGEILFILSHVSITKDGIPRSGGVQAVITVYREISYRAENDRARSKVETIEDSRSPYLARPVLTNPQWRLWTLVRPRD